MNSLCEAVVIRSELAPCAPSEQERELKPEHWFCHVMLVLSRQDKTAFIPLGPVSEHTSIPEQDLMKYIVNAPRQGNAINFFMNQNRVCVRVSVVVNAIYTHCFGNFLIDPHCSKLIHYLLYMEEKAMNALFHKETQLPPKKRHRADEMPLPDSHAKEEAAKAKKEITRLRRVARETKKRASKEKDVFIQDVLALIKNQRNKDTGEFTGRTDTFAAELHELCTRNMVRPVK